MRGETIAFQVALESDASRPGEAHAILGAFDGSPLEVSLFAEDFIDVRRSSGNDRDPNEGLAFRIPAKPEPALLGLYADALLPGRDAVMWSARRGAFWIDIEVPISATPGLRSSRLSVAGAGGVLAEVDVHLRIVDRVLPYAALPVMIYYEPEALKRRMGGLAAEPSLRALFHAHHVSAIRPVLTERDLEGEIPYLTGEAFTSARGYAGPGEGRGEGIVALGAYGDLGAPAATKVPLVAKMSARIAKLGASEASAGVEAFLYAVDEECKSPWPAEWKKLLAVNDETRSLRVGATCGEDPSAHAADIVMQVPEDLAPEKMRAALGRGKQVWAYNGKRPFGGSSVIDVPATDLRANAWIAARYGIGRWFYWEATSWTSYGGGKVGGDTDPFEVADSFHNKDGDHSNGDGVLVYPGAQSAPGMRSLGASTVFPSVRLKNIRRGVQDVGYWLHARASAPLEADAIVARAVPVALSEAKRDAKPSWSDDARPWLDARRSLLDLALRAPADVQPRAFAPEVQALEGAPEGSNGQRLRLRLAVLLAAAAWFAFGARAAKKRGVGR